MPYPVTDPPPAAASLDAMLPLVYEELRSLAAACLRGERPDHTLQPTALVHEAYLRLTSQRTVDWTNRAQFLGLAAQMMRRILVSHAAARACAKRGGGGAKLALDEALDFCAEREMNLLALDEALTDLEALDARQGRIVELRFYGGLTVNEVAETLGISPATVKREWTTAKLWLRREIGATA